MILKCNCCLKGGEFMGELLIIFFILGILIVFGITLIFLVKSPKIQNIIMLLMLALALLMSYIDVTSGPVNITKRGIIDIVESIISISLVVASILLLFKKKKNLIACKILVSLSVIVSFISLLVIY